MRREQIVVERAYETSERTCEMGMWDQDEQAWVGTLCEAPAPYEVIVLRLPDPVPCCVDCACGVRKTGGPAMTLRTAPRG